MSSSYVALKTALERDHTPSSLMIIGKADLTALLVVAEKANQLVAHVHAYMGLPADEAEEHGFDELDEALMVAGVTTRGLV